MAQPIPGRSIARRYARPWLCFAALLFTLPLAAQLRAQVAMTIDGPDIATDENASKTTGFSVKKEDQKVLEQFEDFERYRDKKAWDRAFKSLADVMKSTQANGMAPSKDGFWVPSRQKIFASLVSLPPAGKEAYRLFNDAAAKQLWDQVVAREAAGENDTLVDLKKLVDQYFITAIGDKASDHLGDALFESGDFSGAARAWQQVLQSYPETAIPPLRLEIKQATALSRAGRTEQFRTFAAKLKEKYAGETVKVGGKDVSIEEYLSILSRPTTRPTTMPTTATANSELPLASAPMTLPVKDQPLWQMQFLDDTLSEKIFAQLNQNGWGQQMAGMARAIPTSATDGKRIYLNWYGIIFALDADSGKLIWWSGHFKQLGEKFNELMQWQVDPSRFVVTIAGDSLLTVAVRLDKLNNQEPFRLSCLEPATGKKRWASDSGVLSNWAFIGSPLVVDGTIYITAHPKDAQDNHLLAIALIDGKLLWESPLGQPQIGNNNRGMPVYPVPIMKYSGGMLYVMTNNGAVIAFDTIGHTIEWAFTYEIPPQNNENQRVFWNGNQQVEISEPPGAAWLREGILYFKDHSNKSMYALDLSGPKLLFQRTIGTETMLAGYDDANFYVLSTGTSQTGASQTALGACEWQSGKMLRSSSLPQGSETVQPLLAGGRYYIYLSLGIFEVNTTITDVTRDTKAFRGGDRDAIGGSLLRVGDKLISISNLAVTAYPIGSDARAEK